jgi:hypothetical protein
MTAWPKDTQAARNAFYGDPGKGQIASQMVPVVPPFAMYYEGKRVKAIQFHKKAAPALLAALNEIWDYCQHDQAKVDAAGVSKYAGAYNHRLVRGSKTKWSNHAYAAAIDLNAGENALGVKKGTMPQFVVDAFCRQGAMWGGWYSSRPDWMHFEFVDNGGRQPSSAPPVVGRAARFAGVGEQIKQGGVAPADVLGEDEPEDAGGHQPSANFDPALLSIQTDLKAMNYSPGIPSGKWGGMTAGAIAGFINDYSSATSAPASYDDFAAIRADLLEDVAEAKGEGFKRPVTEARAAADPKTVAEVAPESVPVKRGFWAAIWAAVTTAFASVWDWISTNVSAAWDFFTDNRDSIPTDHGFLSTAWSYVTAVPPIVWGLALCGVFIFLALNLRSAGNQITESVTTGARQ